MQNKKLVLVALSSILCCITCWAQPSKNSYSIGLSGNFTIDNASFNQFPNSKRSTKEGDALLNSNYYFSNCWYIGIIYHKGYSLINSSDFSNKNNRYYNALSNDNYKSDLSGISFGYYKMIGPKILLMLSISCSYGTLNSKGTSIQKDSSIATINTYYFNKNDYNNNGYNYKINISPNVQFMLNKNWSIGLSLADFGYNYSSLTNNQTNTSYYSTDNNGNIQTIEDTKSTSYNINNSKFTGSLALSSLMIGVNYYFKKAKKKIDEED
jgi:hypothetical protein